MSLQHFIEKWTSGAYPPKEVLASDVETVEARFGFAFPEDYRQAVVAHGLPRPSIALLDGILAADVDFPDVSEFFAPAEIIQITEDWRGGGMPDHLVGIAYDCGGSLFCFDASPGADHKAVWFWDHNVGDMTVTADSFTAWIERFVAVEPAPEGWEP